jgi:hypothetical protein
VRADGAGGFHVVYVADVAGAKRVLYRRLGDRRERLADPVLVSPPGDAVSAHGEVGPTLERLAGGILVVAYVVELPGKWQSEVRTQRSVDGGATWSPPALLHDDRRPGSHSFLGSASLADGRAVFAWLDDRDGQQGLRASTTGEGIAFTANRTVDSQTCQCCLPALLASSGGELWLAYRDLEASVRDIAVATSRDGGETFGAPVPAAADGWRVEGCPHTGPRLAVATDGALWVTWFSGADPGVYAARSGDGGRSFGERQRLAATGGEVTAVGHPEIGRLTDGRLAVVYEAALGGRLTLQARIGDAAGAAWSDPLPVVEEGALPRLVRSAQHDLVVYTTRGEGGERVALLQWLP